MKSYLDFFLDGGKNDHYMYLNNDPNRPKLKTKEFIIASDLKKALDKFKSEFMSYVNAKVNAEKNLPKIDEGPTTITRISAIDHINNAIDGNTGVQGLPIGFMYSNLKSTSNL